MRISLPSLRSSPRADSRRAILQSIVSELDGGALPISTIDAPSSSSGMTAAFKLRFEPVDHG